MSSSLKIDIKINSVVTKRDLTNYCILLYKLLIIKQSLNKVLKGEQITPLRCRYPPRKYLKMESDTGNKLGRALNPFRHLAAPVLPACCSTTAVYISPLGARVPLRTKSFVYNNKLFGESWKPILLGSLSFD